MFSLLVFLGCNAEQALAQDCNNIFNRKDLNNELYTLIVRKHAFNTSPGKKILVSAHFFGGRKYLLDFVCEADHNLKIRILNKDKSRVLFEPQGGESIDNIKVNYQITEKVFIEMTLQKNDIQDVANQCIGLLVRKVNDK
jgi:hypothetical protein